MLFVLFNSIFHPNAAWHKPQEKTKQNKTAINQDLSKCELSPTTASVRTCTERYSVHPLSFPGTEPNECENYT